MDQLLKAKDGNIFQSILASVSCLMTLAKVDHTEEISQLVEIVKERRLTNKLLVVIPSALNLTSIRNKSFNFNMIIYHRGDIGIEYLFTHLCNYFLF